jgi:predicted phage-related endonuclease
VGRPVEFKTLSLHNRAYVERLGEEGTDELPEPWLIQVAGQLLCADAAEADVAVFVGGDLRHYTVRREARMDAAILAAVERFWADHVLPRNPPPASVPADAGALAALYPAAEGEVALPGRLVEAALRYGDLGRHAAEVAKRRDEARVELLEALGPHAVGVLPTGAKVVRKWVERASYEVKAARYQTLTIKEPR